MKIKLLLVKTLNIYRFLIYLLIDFIISFYKQEKKNNSLLLIRLDLIGDYLLFRNFLEVIRESEKFKNYHITLLGNEIWKSLAEKFDKEFVDEFIWINRNKFNNNFFYKFKVLKKIYLKGFETVIECSYSREILFGDVIVKTSRAQNRIGSSGANDSYVKWKRNLITNKYYNHIIPARNDIIFEFERNKEFFSQILNQKITINKPYLSIEKVENKFSYLKNFIIVFPGATQKKRKWSTDKFAEVINYIISEYKLLIVIAGSKKDTVLAKKILSKVNYNLIEDLTGKTDLPQLAKLISKAKLLISNETGAIHFAAILNTPFICISIGNHFGRFHPYPDEMVVKEEYIFPDEIKKSLNYPNYLKTKYGYGSNLNINEISANDVIIKVDKFLRNN